MSNHTIKHFNNTDVDLSKTIAISMGRFSKEIKVEWNGASLVYTVLKTHNVVYSGVSAMKAVDTFNDLFMNARNPMTIKPFTDADISFSKEIASSHGRQSNKSIVVTLENGQYTYIVNNKGVVVYSGVSSHKAVDTYNELP